MTNTTIYASMIDSYNTLAYTHDYIFGFEFKGTVYAVETDSTILPMILKLDRASRGQGMCLRFKPTTAQKLFLMTQGAKPLCSSNLFNDEVANSKYNRGEIFEKMITESFGQKWEKDNVPFYMGADLETANKSYQIKFDKASFTTEKTLMNIRNKA